MTQLNTYLNFDGDCEAAFNFYKSVFYPQGDGDFSVVMRYSEMPPSDDFTVPGEVKNLIMHMSLPIGTTCELMGSDVMEGVCGGDKLNRGNFSSIAITPDNESEAKRIFTELSKGGQVMMPLEPQFWSSLFGLCVDKFGVQWMVDFPLEQAEG